MLVAVHQAGAPRLQYNHRQSSHTSRTSSPGQARAQVVLQHAADTPQRLQSETHTRNMNGTAAVPNRSALSDKSVRVSNSVTFHEANGKSPSLNRTQDIDPIRDRRHSLQPRPTTANESHGDSEVASVKRRPNSALRRSKSDFGPRGENVELQNEDETQACATRHGFDDHYASEEYVSQLANSWYMYYTDKRHETTGNPRATGFEQGDWKMKDRLKTVSAALALCLNIGVEPPDQMKTSPSSKLEAWQDPTLGTGQKALESIGKALQAHYEVMALRMRYKQYLDPSVDETKKFCVSLRRNAKEERVLFHYNGHGVPKPTPSGEIWVFNKNYTQYIPVSLYDLQTWLQAPTLFVWDCSDSGNILSNFHRFVEKHEEEEVASAAKDPNYTMINYQPYMHLTACSVKENLPTNPLLPADIFTSCLTTPIDMALWHFVLQNNLSSPMTPERARKLPGRLMERRSPLGELNWIFTAITDTIAWTTLPRPLFRKLFRQDLMVAALFRNFILAQRIMTAYGCHPQAYPELPDTHQHPMWESWDLAVEMALTQLPLLEEKEAGVRPKFEYQNSAFFTEQLTAFEIYLTQGAVKHEVPDQLPVVLQVLLSQQHRVRALILLGKFLDMGPWAVNVALSIGIFPYVLKLLQSAATELKPVMVFVWTRVLAIDLSCQQELLKDSTYQYFSSILKPKEGLPVVDGLEHKAMCAFIITMLCYGYVQGQNVCNQTQIMTYCLLHIHNTENPLLRQWACLCISQLWIEVPEAKWRGIRESAPMKLCGLIRDNCCEVRAAMLYALSTFLGIPDITDEVARIEEAVSWTVIDMASDGNAMVRKEVLVYFSKLVLRYENKFLVAAFEHLREELEYRWHPPIEHGSHQKMGLHYARPDFRNSDGTIKCTMYGVAHNSVFAAVWKNVLIMSVDPHVEVRRSASRIVDYVDTAVISSKLGIHARPLVEELTRRTVISKASTPAPATLDARPNSPPRSESVTNTTPGQPSILKRTASYLFTLPFGSASADSSHPDNLSKISPKSPISQRNPLLLRNRVPAEFIIPPEESDPPTTPGTYRTAKEPTSAGFKKSKDKIDLTSLPLCSTFLEWSIEYFREPQMKPSEAEEPGSMDYNQRLWRRHRNEAILQETQPQKDIAGNGRWTSSKGFLNNSSQPSKMIFHQFEDHLAVSDDKDTVCIWDWKKSERVCRFSNGNPERSKISDMKFINEDDQALLMTGSSDGMIKIYRNYESAEAIEVASAWRALTHLVPSNANPRMVFDWQQVTGRLLVAGDVKVIRVWHAAAEICVVEIPARSGSCITSLTSDQMTGNVFVAGFGDGAIRLFDLRKKASEAMVKKWKDSSDRAWTKSVHMQRGGQRELLSASRNGKVKLWDIRMDKPLRVIHTTKDTIRTASTHEHLPVFAVGTGHHAVKTFNFDGRELSRVEPYSSFLHQSRQSPVSATAFHPHRMILACAAQGDNHVNLFTCGDRRRLERAHSYKADF